ncbi:class C sortase [Lactococcus taiwanensis]|uniref:class C sortase n=1 Tax=Lactococcus taiwanensis TaxID=1151742 RepID=UPI0023F09DE6|nr:class C sortase [Lactococcus taiwanensis]
MKKESSTKKGKRSFRDFLSLFFALVAIGALFYPLLANTLVAHKTTAIITKYHQVAAKLDREKMNEMLTNARAYNEYIYDMSQHLPYRGTKLSYETLLKLDPSGLMGDISIPQIKVSNVPIYHGDAESTLALGVGHLENTSLPIGGVNTHTVLTAHSGRVNNTLFTNLDKLKIGDVFYIDSLNLKLKYKIKTIKIVEPNDVSTLSVQKGKDLATLVTCYPTGINSQRLLVTGQRVSLKEKDVQEEIQRNPYGYDFWVLLGSAVFAGLGGVCLIIKIIKRRKKGEN